MNDLQSETYVHPAATHHNILRRIFRILLWVLGSGVLICILGYMALCLYLTPKRLADIASDYAGKYLDADIRVRRVSFSMWTTFPHFQLQVDSAVIISHRLKGLSDAQRQLLPADCDTLASFLSFNGSINPMELLRDRISIRQLHVKGLRLNMVALNDSINNYNILPSDSRDKPFVMPRFDAREIIFSELRPITYYSVATQASANINLSKISIREKKRDSYVLNLDGRFGLTVQKLSLLHNFPFNFSGKVALRFSPFRMDFDKYNITLGNVRSQVDLSMEIGNNNSQLTNLKYTISPFALLKLFDYLPARWMPQLESIRSNVSLQATARLTAPYKFSSQALPSFRVDFHVPDSWLSYSLPHGTIRAQDIAMNASLIFDGNNINTSRFEISNLSLAGEGISARLRGNINNLFSTPMVSADVTASADFARLSEFLPSGLMNGVTGKVSMHIVSSSSLESLANGKTEEIPFAGIASLENFGYSHKQSFLSIKSKHAKLAFQKLNQTLKLNMDVDNFGLNTKACNVIASGIHVKAISPASLLSSPKKFFSSRSVADLTFDNGSCLLHDSMQIRVHGATIKGNFHNGDLSALVNVRGAQYSDSVNVAQVQRLISNLNLGFKNKFRITGDLKVKHGEYLSAAYPSIAIVNDLDANVTKDNLIINNLKVSSQRNTLSLSGFLHNFKSLWSSSPQAMQVSVNLDIDTLDINQVAGTCKAGEKLLAVMKGYSSSLTAKHSVEPLSSDFQPMLLPQWIDASLRLKASEITYTSLKLFDINADMRIADGIFTLDSINAHTSFGSAFASAQYAGKDSLNMGVNCNVRLDTINIVAFFHQFHKLLDMMPEMKNLSGNISLGVNGGFNLFPDMVMNMPSMTATVAASGTNLQVHQSKFIHRLCRYLMIHTSEDLQIHNIGMKATVHDNQLELYPFTFEMNRYKLSFMGENDFAGHLYYHIAVLHSPLPMKFGVNIEGTFSDYKIRFGGPKFHAQRALHDMSLLQPMRINMVEKLRWLADLFMSKAAETDTHSPHSVINSSITHLKREREDVLSNFTHYYPIKNSK